MSTPEMRPVTCRSGADDANSVTEFLGLTIAKQAKRLGRAKNPRLSRGFPARPALRCRSHRSLKMIYQKDSWGLTLQGRTTPESPGSDGSSPYLSRVFRPSRPAMSSPEMRPVACRSGADDASSVTVFVGLTIVRQAKRLGRAKLRLSRGFPARPALRCQPTGMRSVTCRSGADDASSVTEFVGLTIAKQAKRLGRAKPYLSRFSGSSCLRCHPTGI